MTDRGGPNEPANRREFMQLASAAGFFGITTGYAGANPAATNSGSPNATGDETVLGTFESGLDDWKTTGRNELTQISEDEMSAGVAAGTHALLVTIKGDAFPMIENKKRVRQADFVSNPHLSLQTIALTRNSDSDISLKFRLHHTPSQGSNGNGSSGIGESGSSANTGGRSGGRGSPRSKDVNVVESDVKTIPQKMRKRVSWDLSDVDETVLDSAKRLEIVWYPEDHEPASGFRGQNTNGFDYQGYVAFDDIILTDADPISDIERRHQLMDELRRKHGTIVERNVEQQSVDSTRGTMVLADGYTFEYSAEQQGDGLRTTIDGQTFELF